ncbi:hypothetical protein TNCV_190461 [Trichonephila clavipes]|nr:hypothetical protein TNCV_190461 [Trichonephila clavipes]
MLWLTSDVQLSCRNEALRLHFSPFKWAWPNFNDDLKMGFKGFYLSQRLKPGGNFEKKSTFVIEREISEYLHKFLEESRGFQTRQHDRQCRQNGHQSHKIGAQLGRQRGCQHGSIAKISPRSH